MRGPSNIDVSVGIAPRDSARSIPDETKRRTAVTS
jgi:hypothetical protein